MCTVLLWWLLALLIGGVFAFIFGWLAGKRL